jgi:hypothetical protein
MAAKRTTSALLAVVLALAAGCGGSDGDSSPGEQTGQQETRKHDANVIKVAGGYSGVLAKTWLAGRARCHRGVRATAPDFGLPPNAGFDAVAAKYAQRFELAGGYRDAAYAGCLRGLIGRED